MINNSRLKKPQLNIGTIGHIDHGKTTLFAAIIKCLSNAGEPDKALNYFEDCITFMKGTGAIMMPAYMEYETAKRRYAHIDSPGNADYIKNVINNISRLDGAILVVSAIDGPMLQTREHLLLSSQFCIPAIVVFFNKADMADDPELMELVEMEVRDLLNEYEFPGDETPVITGSALKALNCGCGNVKCDHCRAVWELMNALDDYIPMPEREKDKPFIMPIEDVFSITGRGTMVTGRVERGRIKVGDELEVIGFEDKPRKTVATGVEMFRRPMDYAEAGDNIEVLLHGIDRESVHRGQVLARPASIKPHTKFGAEVYLSKGEEGGRHIPIFQHDNPYFYFKISGSAGTIYLPRNLERVMPGQSLHVFIELDIPLPLEKGSRFVFREGGRTVGTGIINEL